MLAIKSGNSKCFSLLLSPETAIILNQKDKIDKTALIYAIDLIYAIESKNVNLVKKFISVTKKVLGGVNEYYPERKVKLEICADTSKCIQSIKDKNIESLITKFISESSEHISMPCKIPLPLLKRKNTESIPATQKSPKTVETIIKLLPKRKNHKNTNEPDNGTPEKKRKTALCVVIEFDCKTKGFTGPFSKKIDKLKKYTNYVQRALDSINKIYCKLDNLEKKRQKVGQFLLEKLLHEADSSNLTSGQKKEILGCINNLVIEANIEFSEDLVQAIQMPDAGMRSKIFDIITHDAKEKEGPSSQLHFPINSLAGSSLPQR
jgi:hypothetical protein